MAENLIDRFYRARDARTAWPDEVARRAQGLDLKIGPDFFFHMNPLYEPNSAMQYIVGRYEAAYDALARLRPQSVLEIGCAQGLSTWLMTSFAARVTGLDIREDRVAIGRHMFPEVEWVVADFRAFLSGASGRFFDVIINSHGPVYTAPEITASCRSYIYIGYRPQTWRAALTGSHKIAGRQLSFSTTLQAENQSGVDGGYWQYFLRRNFLKEAKHALVNRHALPL
jgi:SAM-dependent methyltransferase